MEETVNASPERAAGAKNMTGGAQHLPNPLSSMTDAGEKTPVIIELRSVLNVTAALPTAKQFIEHRGNDVFVDGSNVQHLGGQGLQILVSALRSWTEDGLSFVLGNCSDKMIADLKLFGFEPHYFTAVESLP